MKNFSPPSELPAVPGYEELAVGEKEKLDFSRADTQPSSVCYVYGKRQDETREAVRREFGVLQPTSGGDASRMKWPEIAAGRALDFYTSSHGKTSSSLLSELGSVDYNIPLHKKGTGTEWLIGLNRHQKVFQPQIGPDGLMKINLTFSVQPLFSKAEYFSGVF